MSTGLKANNDGSAAIQVGGTDYIQISSTGNVTIPQSQTISGNLIVTGTATVGGQPVGGNYILNSYVAPATWTKGAGLKAIKVTVVGAGGSGGSATNPSTGTQSSAAGGGGGGAAIEYIPAPSIPGPVVVTAGPGTNSFGAFCSATAGGTGGSFTSGGPQLGASGGAGGAGSGGTFNIAGGGGNSVGSGGYASGAGGASILGGGGAGVGAPTVGANPGGNYGGGGSGGNRPNPNAGTSPGGAGAPGIVIVEEFY